MTEPTGEKRLRIAITKAVEREIAAGGIHPNDIIEAVFSMCVGSIRATRDKIDARSALALNMSMIFEMAKCAFDIDDRKKININQYPSRKHAHAIYLVCSVAMEIASRAENQEAELVSFAGSCWSSLLVMAHIHGGLPLDKTSYMRIAEDVFDNTIHRYIDQYRASTTPPARL